LAAATIAGARAAHLDHKIGTLSPGKEADVIMLATDRIKRLPAEQRGRMERAGPRPGIAWFARDSPLEEGGFEPLVPL
jgi:cytosine/adenosine deaminase-related metal-dependent hydrolase